MNYAKQPRPVTTLENHLEDARAMLDKSLPGPIRKHWQAEVDRLTKQLQQAASDVNASDRRAA